MKDKQNLALPIILMVVLAISMWPGMSQPLAHALGLGSGQNFSAAYALAFCAGVFFPERLRWILPLGMFLVINVLTNIYYGVGPWVGVQYLILKLVAFAVLIWLGTRFSPKNKWFKLVGGGVLGAILFYLITNTASWLWDPVYPKTFAGWIQALTSGTPGFPPTVDFFLNSLLSGGLFTGLFAGAMKLTATAEEPQPEEQEEAEAEETADLPVPEKSDA